MPSRPRYARHAALIAGFAVACLLAVAPGVSGQDTAPEAAELVSALASARNHGDEAAQYERARNYRAAVQYYQRAVNELANYMERSPASPGRPRHSFNVYWMLGSARLDLARAWVLSGLGQGGSAVEQARFVGILGAAKQDLLSALQIDANETTAAGGAEERGWKLRSALAWHAILEGDATTALAEAQRANASNPDNPYAPSLERAIAALSVAGGSDSRERAGTRPSANLPDDVVAALRSVIDVGNFIAAAAPEFAMNVAMRGAATCPPAFTGTCYPVWFGTNRKLVDPSQPSKGFTGEYDDEIRYGKRIVSIPKGHRVGEIGSPLWRRLLTRSDDRIEVGPSTVLSEQAFVHEIRDVLGKLDPGDRHVLVFIHGYKTSFDAASRHAAQLGFDLKVPGITMLYSWPSRGNVSDYVADIESVEASEEQIAQFLVKAAALADRGQVHIIAHSMGNRGLLRAMHRATAQAAIRAGVRFGKIFLAAPDVDVKLFRQLASIYPQISERTTLYVGDQDRAIAASEWVSREPRAGSVPPLTLVPGIDTIRVRGASLFRLGHNFVAEDVNVLLDISTLLYGKDPPARRGERNGWPVLDQTAKGGGAWVIGE
jgi:esterase/lipase superfamily enzyme